MRPGLSIPLFCLACGPVPDVAPVDDGACAERIDPLRDDDRTPFGLRPNQVRAAAGGSWTGSLDGDEVVVTLGFTGGLATQVWADPTGQPGPEPPPPRWCTDRTELSATLRLQGEDPRLDAFVEPVVGRAHAHGPIADLQLGFTGSVDGTAAPELLGDDDPVATQIFVWAYLEEGRVELRAGADPASTREILVIGLEGV